MTDTIVKRCAENASAAVGYFGVSCYRRAENIRILPIVIAELELNDKFSRLLHLVGG
jgi:hypothetical protein